MKISYETVCVHLICAFVLVIMLAFIVLVLFVPLLGGFCEYLFIVHYRNAIIKVRRPPTSRELLCCNYALCKTNNIIL